MILPTTSAVECDVLVAGSGAGGLAAAVAARKAGLEVIVAEKEPLYGGTTARSGGWLWIPNHPMQAAIGVRDSLEEASTYLLHETGEKYDPERVNAFLTEGPRMVDWFQRETAVRFDASATFSDYHPDAPGGKPGGRSIVASAYDGRELGTLLDRLRPPLPELTVFGVMIGSGVELVHFMRWSKSLASAAFVARRLLGHGLARLVYGRGVRLTNGNALAGRLVEVGDGCGGRALEFGADRKSSQGRQRRAGSRSQEGRQDPARQDPQGRCPCMRRLSARSGKAQAKLFPHARHYSPAPPGNVGDGLRLAQRAGGRIDETLPNAAAWVPVSQVPREDGSVGLFPHFIDRAKPGVIAVTRKGRRFVNEGNSYHDFVQALYEGGASRPGDVGLARSPTTARSAPTAWVSSSRALCRSHRI